jgi:hypothetical protein
MSRERTGGRTGRPRRIARELFKDRIGTAPILELVEEAHPLLHLP